MSRPVVSEVAEGLYTILQPLAFADEQNGWALLYFCEALIGAVQKVQDYSADGWNDILDIDNTPNEALPWLAQFVGVVVPPRISTDSDSDYYARIRAYIKSTPGFSRGTPVAIVAEVLPYLTGTKTVIFRERFGGAYKLEVRTYTSQTPSEANVLAAILRQKPAGITLDYDSITGQDYQQLFTNFATYQLVFTTYDNYQELVTATP